MKSTTDQIRNRFDNDVERFTNLDTGQTATMDARLCMELLTASAAATTPNGKDVLDIGSGAGNYTLMMLQHIPNLNCTLVDLSANMLERAAQRVHEKTAGKVTTLQLDMRDLQLPDNSQDIVLAAAALHHLRTDGEWHSVFEKIFRALRPGGSFWIFDYIQHDTAAIHQLMQQRHGDYLISLKPTRAEGEKYRNHVFAYIDEEDTPRSVNFQLQTLADVGFTHPEILHKNSLFAAFGAQKPHRS